jgi:hypothetical protein
VALKAAFDAWASASGTSGIDKPTAFRADEVPSVEKGLGGFFQMANGLTLITLGLSLALGRVFPRRLGWVGTIAGTGWFVGGVVAAHTGFSGGQQDPDRAAGADRGVPGRRLCGDVAYEGHRRLSGGGPRRTGSGCHDR